MTQDEKDAEILLLADNDESDRPGTSITPITIPKDSVTFPMKQGGEKDTATAKFNNEPPTDEEDTSSPTKDEPCAAKQGGREDTTVAELNNEPLTDCEPMESPVSESTAQVLDALKARYQKASRELLISQINLVIDWKHPVNSAIIVKEILDASENNELREFALNPQLLYQKVEDRNNAMSKNHKRRRQDDPERAASAQAARGLRTTKAP